jgi:dUTP pyrophosphatase
MNIHQYGGVPLKQGHETDAGWDIYAAEDLQVYQSQSVLLLTGVHLALPDDVFAMVCSRSGLASKGLVVGNAPGIIDPGYRGEILVNMHYRGPTRTPNEISNQSVLPSYFIRKGDKVAQIVFRKTVAVELTQVQFRGEFDSMDETSRAAEGHGSTGR